MLKTDCIGTFMNQLYVCKFISVMISMAHGFFCQCHILFRTGDLYKILKLGGTNTSVFDIEEMEKSWTNLFSYHGVYSLQAG